MLIRSKFKLYANDLVKALHSHSRGSIVNITIRCLKFSCRIDVHVHINCSIFIENVDTKWYAFTHGIASLPRMQLFDHIVWIENSGGICVWERNWPHTGPKELFIIQLKVVSTVSIFPSRFYVLSKSLFIFTLNMNYKAFFRQ